MTDECVYLVVTEGTDHFRVLEIFKSEEEAEQYKGRKGGQTGENGKASQSRNIK